MGEGGEGRERTEGREFLRMCEKRIEGRWNQDFESGIEIENEKRKVKTTFCQNLLLSFQAVASSAWTSYRVLTKATPPSFPRRTSLNNLAWLAIHATNLLYALDSNPSGEQTTYETQAWCLGSATSCGNKISAFFRMPSSAKRADHPYRPRPPRSGLSGDEQTEGKPESEENPCENYFEGALHRDLEGQPPTKQLVVPPSSHRLTPGQKKPLRYPRTIRGVPRFHGNERLACCRG